jgi:hypothetical protein
MQIPMTLYNSPLLSPSGIEFIIILEKCCSTSNSMGGELYIIMVSKKKLRCFEQVRSSNSTLSAHDICSFCVESPV